ncbi:MAG TPA: CAP domain-containing protein [Conexibacter sp.]
MLNQRRARFGMRPLRYNRCLDLAAERHARDMVARHYFDHSSSTGRDLTQRARAAGYVPRAGSWRVGENLAWGVGPGSTARGAVLDWMRSPPHRANVLQPRYHDVGVAVVHGAPVPDALGRLARAGAATFVAEFGARTAAHRCGR